MPYGSNNDGSMLINMNIEKKKEFDGLYSIR